jgi:hypothetical protein
LAKAVWMFGGSDWDDAVCEGERKGFREAEDEEAMLGKTPSSVVVETKDRIARSGGRAITCPFSAGSLRRGR